MPRLTPRPAERAQAWRSGARLIGDRLAAMCIGIRVDGSAVLGVGHVIRCLALADELRARDIEVLLVGRVEGVDWVQDEIQDRSLPIASAPMSVEGFLDLARERRFDAVILDGYDLPPLGAALRAIGVVVLAVVDAEFGAHQHADLYLDQNLGAATRPRPVEGATELMGLDYVMFRDQVLSCRGLPSHAQGTRPRVLAIFGGTDAFGAAPTLVATLLATHQPVEVIAVAARPGLASIIDALWPGPGQTVEVIQPVSDLASLAVTCDLTVTASGSSVWELLCLGVPAALVCVVDNQRFGYEAAVSRGVALGLGALSEIARDPSQAVGTLAQALQDPDGLEALSRRGRELVDGQGRRRVVDALMISIEGEQV